MENTRHCSSSAHNASVASACPLTYFENMIAHCLEYATAAHASGRPIVGILCEYTPRELILAAGGVPVCLCGGSADTIPAAERELPTNLCPLIKSTYGYLLENSNPFLAMASLVVGETTCDGKKKMYELMAEKRPVYVLELPQKENDPDALAHWEAELRKFKNELERRFSVSITDDKIRAATEVMNRERRLRRALAELMKSDAPPLTGRQLITLKSSISGIPEDFAQYEKARALFGDQCPGPAARKIRVLMTGTPMVNGAERVLEIIEAHGGLVVCMENCSGVKPILDDVDITAPDPIRALAERYYHLPCPVMTPNARRIESLRALAKEYRAECVVEVILQACLTYDVESFRIRRLCEEELAIPYLRIETDYSNSDSPRMATRIGALFETACHS